MKNKSKMIEDRERHLNEKEEKGIETKTVTDRITLVFALILLNQNPHN